MQNQGSLFLVCISFPKKRLTFKIQFCGIQVLLIIFMYENLYFCIECQLNEAIPDRSKITKGNLLKSK
jgi:hypothetical protein